MDHHIDVWPPLQRGEVHRNFAAGSRLTRKRVPGLIHDHQLFGFEEAFVPAGGRNQKSLAAQPGGNVAVVRRQKIFLMQKAAEPHDLLAQFLL
jgi:hypothetical protein